MPADHPRAGSFPRDKRPPEITPREIQDDTKTRLVARGCTKVTAVPHCGRLHHWKRPCFHRSDWSWVLLSVGLLQLYDMRFFGNGLVSELWSVPGGCLGTRALLSGIPLAVVLLVCSPGSLSVSPCPPPPFGAPRMQKLRSLC